MSLRAALWCGNGEQGGHKTGFGTLRLAGSVLPVTELEEAGRPVERGRII